MIEGNASCVFYGGSGMNPTAWYVNEKESFEIVLGYLNFSSGILPSNFLEH